MNEERQREERGKGYELNVKGNLAAAFEVFLFV